MFGHSQGIDSRLLYCKYSKRPCGNDNNGDGNTSRSVSASKTHLDDNKGRSDTYIPSDKYFKDLRLHTTVVSSLILEVFFFSRSDHERNKSDLLPLQLSTSTLQIPHHCVCCSAIEIDPRVT